MLITKSEKEIFRPEKVRISTKQQKTDTCLDSNYFKCDFVLVSQRFCWVKYDILCCKKHFIKEINKQVQDK